MSSQLETAAADSVETPDPAAAALTPGVRFVASAMIAFHAFCVFWAPFHFSTIAPDGIPSPATTAVREFIDPYIGAMYLHHGYFFFAPDPGPSHLLRYEIVFADGRRVSGQLPDRQAHWPRLLYHRHFMIAEFVNDMFAPTDEPRLAPLRVGANAAERRVHQLRARDFEVTTVAPWRRQRDVYLAVRASIERHLRKTYAAEEIKEVVLKRIQHELYSFPEEEERRIDLRQPWSYVELPETSPPPERSSWNPQQTEPALSRP